MTLANGRLYIADTGNHAVREADLESRTISTVAGTGREGLHDDLRNKAWLAQPSGLTIMNNRLYFIDSEASALRYVELDTDLSNVGAVVGNWNLIPIS